MSSIPSKATGSNIQGRTLANMKLGTYCTQVVPKKPLTIREARGKALAAQMHNLHKREQNPLEHQYRLMAYGEEQKRRMLTAAEATRRNKALQGSGCYWQLTKMTCLNQPN